MIQNPVLANTVFLPSFIDGGWELVIHLQTKTLRRKVRPKEREQIAITLFGECFEPAMITKIADTAEVTRDIVFLQVASHHHDWQVRVSSIVNGTLPQGFVKRMCSDPDPSVRAAALRSPHRSGELVDRVLSATDVAVGELVGVEFLEDLRAGLN